MQWNGMEWNGCISSILGPFDTFGYFRSILGHSLDKKTPFQNVRPSGRICWVHLTSLKFEFPRFKIECPAPFLPAQNALNFDARLILSKC